MTQRGKPTATPPATTWMRLLTTGLAGTIDAILVNDRPVSEAMRRSYERFGSAPVRVDDDRLKALGVKVVRAPIAAESDVVRHDSGASRAGAPAPGEVARMGFTRDVKLELVTVMPAAEHCRRARLSGLLFGAGTFDLGPGGHFGVRISVAHPALARHALSLLKPLQVEAQLRTVDSAPIGLRYEVLVGDEGRGLQVLNELGVISDQLAIQMTVPRRLVERHCCLVAFLRGLFLVGDIGARRPRPRRVHRGGRGPRRAGPALPREA